MPPGRVRSPSWRAVTAAALALRLAGPAAAAPPPGAGRACEAASRAAEAADHLPAGLLAAIGRVESGRYSATLGRIAPWPWAVDIAGSGVAFATRSQALAAIRTARDAGQRNIDVGCFQVNLGAHPDAFPDLRTALDPMANAGFAAGFLVRLHARLGGWRAAAAAYHSETAALAAPYLLAVMRSWAGQADAPARAPAADRTWVLVTPVRGLLVVAPGDSVVAAVDGMRIITPTSAGASAAGPMPDVRYGPMPR